MAYRGTRTLMAEPEHFAKRRESQVDEQSGKLPGG
jgi:hypothetical protein